jgi:hypothetical protein
VIDITKKYQTRDGRPVEILSTNGRRGWSVIGYIGDNPTVRTWTSEGRIDVTPWTRHDEDLIEIKEKKTRTYWLNIYDDCAGVYSSEANAVRGQLRQDIQARKQITIEYEEGEGL